MFSVSCLCFFFGLRPFDGTILKEGGDVGLAGAMSTRLSREHHPQTRLAFVAQLYTLSLSKSTK